MRKNIRLAAIRTPQVHKGWEERMQMIGKADTWVVDVSHSFPEQWLYMGMALLRNKSLLILSQKPLKLSARFDQIPVLQYEATEAGIEDLKVKLTDYAH